MLGVRSTQLQEVGGVQLGWKSTSDAARRWAPPMPKAGATDGNDPRAGGFAPGSLFTGVRGSGIPRTSPLRSSEKLAWPGPLPSPRMPRKIAHLGDAPLPPSLVGYGPYMRAEAQNRTPS